MQAGSLNCGSLQGIRSSEYKYWWLLPTFHHLENARETYSGVQFSFQDVTNSIRVLYLKTFRTAPQGSNPIPLGGGGVQSNMEQFQSAELKFFPAYDFPSYLVSHVILGFLRLDFLLLFQNLLAGKSLVSRLEISLGSRGCLLSSLVSQH